MNWSRHGQACLTAGIASVAQNRGIQLNSVKATLEAGTIDIIVIGAGYAGQFVDMFLYYFGASLSNTDLRNNS